MAIAMLVIPSMDILGKLVSKEINGIQVAQWRFGFQALLILPVLLWLRGAAGLLPKRIGLNIVRALLIAGAVTLMIFGVFEYLFNIDLYRGLIVRYFLGFRDF